MHEEEEEILAEADNEDEEIQDEELEDPNEEDPDHITCVQHLHYDSILH